MIEDYINQIICGDCLEVMKGIPDNSIDSILTDPPYGFGLDTWDKKIDIKSFTKQIDRIMKKTGFYIFFGQMPTVIDWINEANIYFKFKEHITWVKRTCLPSKRLMRGHEEIFIYAKDGMKFYQNKGNYEDIKVPGIMFDVISIEAIKRYISSLRAEIKTGKLSMRSHSNKGNKIYKRLWGWDVKSSRAPEYANFTNVWSFLPENQKTFNKKEYGHPMQKPILLIKRLIEMLSLKDMIIFDPFLGSGTTAVACKELGRKYIGIELNKEYCEIAKNRINTIPEPLFV